MDNPQHYPDHAGLGLSDLAFRRLATPNLASTLFVLGWLALLLVAAILFLVGLYLIVAVGGWLVMLGIVLLAAAPIVLLAGIMIIRILLEAAVLLYRIEANTRVGPGSGS